MFVLTTSCVTPSGNEISYTKNNLSANANVFSAVLVVSAHKNRYVRNNGLLLDSKRLADGPVRGQDNVTAVSAVRFKKNVTGATMWSGKLVRNTNRQPCELVNLSIQ